MSKRKGKAVRLLPTVTFRTLTVDFVYRKISVDGQMVTINGDYVSIPILSGDAVFVPRSDTHERIA